MIGDVLVADTGSRGKGVFARRDFAEGEFIFRRRHGRVLPGREIPSLSDEERSHLCELDFDTYAVLLEPGCYLNHSCEPSAMRSGVKVFAWRPLRAGEEVTVDYRLNAYDDNETWTCLCGSEGCGGVVVGSFFSLSISS